VAGFPAGPDTNSAYPPLEPAVPWSFDGAIKAFDYVVLGSFGSQRDLSPSFCEGTLLSAARLVFYYLQPPEKAE